MDNFLEGRTAVITGGTKGIGLAIAAAVAKAGARVVICGRTQNAVDIAVRHLSNLSRSKVAGKAADVKSSTEVKDFFEFVDQEMNGFDILVNNAGVGVFKSTADLTTDDWQTVIETNLTGVFYCCREALARFKQRVGGGYIINISSLAGKNPFTGGAAYNASKFGLNGFSESMMLDHRNDNVKVSYIMPGSVDTDFSTRSERASWKIDPADIGEIVLMLLRMPERTLVSRVEVRPSKPKK